MYIHGAFLYFRLKCLKHISIRAIFFIEHTQNHQVFSIYFYWVKKRYLSFQIIMYLVINRYS
ncbi:hypothetical protein CPI40_07205 [Moraxella catarrhalis]|nr:hypothetical protein [Moraxella catarrhalis]